MSKPVSFTSLAVVTTVIVSLVAGAYAQPPPYWAPGRGGVEPGREGLGPEERAAMAYDAPGAMPAGMAAPGMAAPGAFPRGSTPGTLAYAPEPPQQLLIGERLKESGVDREWIDVEAVTGADIVSDELIPRISTIDEYKRALTDTVPAIYFNDGIWVFDKETNTYRERDFFVRDHNRLLWAQVQFERQLMYQAYLAQMRQAIDSYYRSRATTYGDYGRAGLPGQLQTIGGTRAAGYYGPRGPTGYRAGGTGYPGPMMR